MTETEWLACDDPTRMLKWLCAVTGSTYGGPAERERRPSDRKLRLFGAAILRLRRTTHAPALAAIDRAERYADDSGGVQLQYHQPGELCYIGDIPQASRMVSEALRDLAVTDRPAAAVLLRDIAGNPWRPPAPVRRRCINCQGAGRARHAMLRGTTAECPACRGRGLAAVATWLTPTVLSLARAAYEERPGRECGRCAGSGRIEKNGADHPCPDCTEGRIEDGLLDPVRLAILADALEEAGHVDPQCAHCIGGHWGEYESGRRIDCSCVHHRLLAHLRSPGPHVRGCWALDLVLGKD